MLRYVVNYVTLRCDLLYYVKTWYTMSGCIKSGHIRPRYVKSLTLGCITSQYVRYVTLHNVAIRQVRHIAYVTAGEKLIQGSGARHRQRIPYECGSDFTARLTTGPVPACANAKPDATKAPAGLI